MNKRILKGLVKKVAKTDGLLTAVVGSTAAVDRYGEIVNQETFQLDNYKKNPVILWAHNLSFGEDRPPIGKAIRVEVKNGQLEFDIQFDMADPFAADIFRKYKEKFLNAFSVGFIAHDVARNDEGATVLLNNELLELSAVPVPANPEALQSLRARSFAVRDWDKMIKEVEDENEDHAEPAKDDTTDPKPKDEVTAPADPANGAQDESDISGDDSQGKPVDEIEGGESERSSSPINPKQVASKQLVAVVREATRQLQTVLAMVNAEAKEAGLTPKKGNKNTE